MKSGIQEFFRKERKKRQNSSQKLKDSFEEKIRNTLESVDNGKDKLFLKLKFPHLKKFVDNFPEEHKDKVWKDLLESRNNPQNRPLLEIFNTSTRVPEIENFIKNHPDKWYDLFKLLNKCSYPFKILTEGIPRIQEFVEKNPDKWNDLIELGIICRTSTTKLFYSISSLQNFIDKNPEEWENLVKFKKIIGSKDSEEDILPTILRITKDNPELGKRYIKLGIKYGEEYPFIFIKSVRYLENLLKENPEKLEKIIKDLVKLGEINTQNNVPLFTPGVGEIAKFVGNDYQKWDEIIELGINAEGQCTAFLIYGVPALHRFYNNCPEKREDLKEELKKPGKNLGDVFRNGFRYGLSFWLFHFENYIKNDSEKLSFIIERLKELLPITGSKLLETSFKGTNQEKSFESLQEFLKENPDKWEVLTNLEGKLSSLQIDIIQSTTLKLKEFLKENPDKFEQVIKDSIELGEYSGKNNILNIEEHFGNLDYLIREYPQKRIDILKVNTTLSEDGIAVIKNLFDRYPHQWNNIEKWLKSKVIRSKTNTEIFGKITKKGYFKSEKFKEIFLYLVENKQKQIIPFFEKILTSNSLNLNLDITKFRNLDELKDENGDFEQEKITENYSKMLKITETQKEKQQKKIEQLKKLFESETPKMKKETKEETQKQLEEKLKQKLGEALYNYFNYLYEKKLSNRIQNFLKNKLGKKESTNIDIKYIAKNYKEFFFSELFIESYKILQTTKTNKKQGEELLKRFILNLNKNSSKNKIPYQYDTKANIKWLRKNMNKETSKKRLSPNRREIEIDNNEENDGKQDKEQNINHHYKVGIDKINQINEKLGFEFEENFKTYGKLVDYFNNTIKPRKKEIKELEKKQETNLYEDLNLQIQSLQNLFKDKSSKKVDKIIIEKETDPFRILMMGNRVNGSCLNYYSDTNYWSTITNAVDINKGVFYIKDEKEKVIGRGLVGIDRNQKIVKFRLYRSGNIAADLNTHFNQYLKELAKELGLGINGDPKKIKLIEGEKWYIDPVSEI